MTPLSVNMDPGGLWGVTVFFMVCFCAIYPVSKWYSKVGLFPTLLWLFVLFRTFYILEYPDLPFGLYNVAFKATAGQVAVEALLIPLAALMAPKNILKIIAPIVVLIDIPLIWIGDHRGIQCWESFDCALIAMCVPFIPMWMVIGVLATILTRHCNTALLIILAQLAVVSFYKKRLRKYFLLLIPVAIYFSHKHHVNVNFDTGERFLEYKKLLEFWTKFGWDQKIIGTGGGSFIWLSLLLDKFQPPLWLQAHQEWIQLLIEFGITGVLLALLTFVTAIKRSFHSMTTLAALMGAFMFTLSFHPWRFGVSAFISALILRNALFSKKKGRAKEDKTSLAPVK